jgi:hypothetical protein
MENLIRATERLIDAIKALHVEMDMSNPKHEECYMALHSCREIIKKASEGNQFNSKSGNCTIFDVSGSLPANEDVQRFLNAMNKLDENGLLSGFMIDNKVLFDQLRWLILE